MMRIKMRGPSPIWWLKFLIRIRILGINKVGIMMTSPPTPSPPPLAGFST
jgi:hypothetical protein